MAKGKKYLDAAKRFDRERRIAVQADLNGAELGTALATRGKATTVVTTWMTQ